MKMEKKLIIVALLLLSLFMIGAVSAASNTTETSVNTDVNDDEKVSHTSTNSENVAEKTNTDTISEKKSIGTKKETDDKLSSKPDNNVLKETDNGTFTALNKKINDNDEITLENDYKYDDTDYFPDGITINKKITIHGNGKTINANGKTRIFLVTETGNLILENLILTQGNHTRGGAIYAQDNSQVTITQSTLQNNQADENGGAIYTRSYLNITQSTLQNNNASCGGAICANFADVRITSSKLQNNKANNGGAIYAENYSQLTINNSTLQNNNATLYGGAISAWYNSQLTINNSTLQNNQASEGGAIYAISNAQINITQSTLQNNQADEYGGAIYASSSDANITTSILQNNQATSDGGAIWATYSNINITNSTLQNNQATLYGGAIWATNMDWLAVNHNVLLNNTGNYVIYLKSSTSDLFNLDYNWFGHTATNYMKIDKIIDTRVTNNWLFLNASADPNPVQFGSTSNIIFKLSCYNGTNVTGYDNSQLKPVNLTISSINGTTNPRIASLGEEITYTPSTAGTGSVTASINGVEYTILVTVNLNPANVTVNNNTLDLTVDDTFNLVATTTPGGLNVTYVPDESGVYSVDENGLVTALKEGTGKILVKVTGNVGYAENSTTVNVTVSKIPTEIIVKNTTINMKVNEEVDPDVSISPADAGELDYTSSDVSVVVVNGDGTFTAVGEGNANVTIRFLGNDKYATAISKIINVTVSLNDANVTVNNDTLNLLVDEEFTINATTTPEGLNVTYIPDNSGVVSVDENGKITALKEGTAPIIVKINGKGVYFENSTTVTVTVSKIPTTINLAQDSFTLTVDDNVDTGASLTPTDAGSLTYTSSDTSIAKVENGKIIAVGSGSAKITVTFAGNEKYDVAANKTIQITVNSKPTPSPSPSPSNPTVTPTQSNKNTKIKTKISAKKKVTFKSKTKIKKVKVKLKTGKKALRKVKVTLKIKGKKYKKTFKAKTNKKGIATFKIRKLTRKGKYTATITFKGDKNYKASKKTVKIIVK